MTSDPTEPTEPPKPPRLPPRWFIRARLGHAPRRVSVTGGRVGSADRGRPYGSLRLHTIGRHSGKERIAMLGYKMDGPNLVTVAMNGWAIPSRSGGSTFRPIPRPPWTSRTAPSR